MAPASKGALLNIHYYYYQDIASINIHITNRQKRMANKNHQFFYLFSQNNREPSISWQDIMERGTVDSDLITFEVSKLNYCLMVHNN